MTIIEKYEPINTKEKVDSLIAELRTIPHGMSKNVRMDIFNRINKAKIQLYLNEEYPESVFTDANGSIPEYNPEQTPAQASANATSASTQQSVSASANVLKLPVPSGTEGSLKYINGTYIEMAFHNLFMNMQHIYLLVFGQDIIQLAKNAYNRVNPYPWNEDFASERYVWEPMMLDFKNASQPEQKLKIEELLNRHFPMLVPIKEAIKDNNDYKDLSGLDIIENFSIILRLLRHNYSHYVFIPNPDQESRYEDKERFVSNCLYTCFLGASRIVKERFAFSDSEIQCARSFVIKDREKVDVENYKYHLFDKNTKHFTKFGLVFFISMFLEKRYSKIYSDKMHVIASSDQKVIGEMLSVYRMRLNCERITVEKDVQANALDILNEVRRCPGELFEMLSPKDQAKFRIKSESELFDDTLMIRHSDRFPHLVMKYIDSAHLFSDIRFQVSLGKYFYKFYNKSCIDHGEKRVRAICKTLNGFGRIEEIEKMRSEGCWKEMIRQYEDVHANTADEKPYITDHHAQYIISDNRIGMKIMDNDPRAYLPELTDTGARNLAPTCWLSTYDLPAMVFLLHLTSGDYVEDIIKSTVANYKKFFYDVHTGELLPVNSESELEDILKNDYGINRLSDIPQNIKNYLLCRKKDASEHFKRCATAMLDRLIEQTKYKQEKNKRIKERVGTKDNKIGKKSYVQLRPGEMAAFLAKDMMFFQPNDAENKYKLTGLNFRVLQSVLATYNGEDPDLLKRTLISARIIGAKDRAMCNPIVRRIAIEKCMSTEEFYSEYLKARKAYLEECKWFGRYGELSFMHGDRMKWQVHDEEFSRLQARRYLVDEYGGKESEKAIELPKGLFDDYIRCELQSMPSMKDIAERANTNVSYLIYGYFKNVMKDDCQWFYEAGRSYRLFNSLFKTKEDKDDKYFTEQEILKMLVKSNKKESSIITSINKHLQSVSIKDQEEEYKKLHSQLHRLKKTETILKRYKVQDMLLLLIAKKVFASSEEKVQSKAIDQLKLKEIHESGSLSKKISVRIPVCSKRGYRKVIEKNEMTLKNYANLYQLLSDRRLPALLDLVNDYRIIYNDIESELMAYDDVHPKILKEVLLCEKKYLQANPNVPEVKFADTLASFEPASQNTLKNIRNAFAHTSYPKRYDVAVALSTDLPDKAKEINNKFQNDLQNNP